MIKSKKETFRYRAYTKAIQAIEHEEEITSIDDLDKVSGLAKEYSNK